MMDKMILVYEGIEIRKSDRRILESSSHLNDRIIEFYFSYLSCSYSTNDILLVPPSVSLSLAESSDPKHLKETIKPLNLDQRELIFFPVIDHDDLTQDGRGSHWSLLVYYRTLHSFIHHDSLGGINNIEARRLYEKVKDLVGFGGSRKSKWSRKSESRKHKRCRSEACFTECFTPQQANQYDSGLYVMVTADVICGWFTSWSMNERLFWLSALEKRIKGSYVELNMRAEVLELLDTLQREYSCCDSC